MSEKTKEVPQLADTTYAHTLVIKSINRRSWVVHGPYGSNFTWKVPQKRTWTPICNLRWPYSYPSFTEKAPVLRGPVWPFLAWNTTYNTQWACIKLWIYHTKEVKSMF